MNTNFKRTFTITTQPYLDTCAYNNQCYKNILMVNVVPSNEKLQARAIQLVRALTQTGVEEARKALHLSGGKVTVAVERLKKVSRLPRKR